MFKLFQNLLSNENSHKQTAIVKSEASDWKVQIARADELWEQGKISEALAIYGLAIEQNPNLPNIKQRLAERIKHQGDLAVAYEKLATGLKNQGKIDQAANYYRQAINLKAVTGNTRNQLLRSSIIPVKKSPIPLASLKEAAFSFQPLTNNTAIVRVAASPPTAPNLDEDFNVSPQFSPRIKAVNPQQARDIDWETAQVYFQKALEHLEKQEWEQSALACKQATQIMPDMAEAYKIWGNALQRMGETGEAMSCYAKAVEVKPNLAEVYAGIADIYAQQEKWQQAIKHYQKATIIKPSASTYRKLAAIWQRIGETDKVEFNLYQATELELSQTSSMKTLVDSELASIDRNDVEGSVAKYCRVARQLEKQQQWQDAAKYYRQALDLSMSRLNLPPAKSATVEQKQKQKLASVPQLEIRSSANTVSKNIATNNVVSKASTKSQIDKAIERYHQQAKLQPKSPKIYTDLGNLYAKKRNFSEAIACYRRAIRSNRRYSRAHLNLARALLRTGKSQEFTQEMQLALALQPKIGTAMDRFYLGSVLVQQKQEQQAIGFYYKAIVLNSQFAEPYHRIAAILSKQGKRYEAIEFLEQAVKKNPRNAESHYLLGLKWEQLENWENAVKIFGRVLQIEPQYPEASKKLNHALAQKLRTSKQVKSPTANYG